MYVITTISAVDKMWNGSSLADSDGKLCMTFLDKNASANSAEVELFTLPMHQAAVVIWQVGVPAVVIAGTFGNLMIILIQGRIFSGQDSSMSVFFIALAVSDLLSLWFDPLFWWLDTFGVKLNASHDALCKLRVFLAYMTGHTSAWILVTMAFQRAGSIIWPHRVNVLCSRQLASLLVCALFGSLAAVNAHILYGQTMQPRDNQTVAECFFTFINDEYEAFYNQIWGWIDTSLCTTIPFALLLLANIVLVRTVGQALRKTRMRLASGQSGQLNVRERKIFSMTVTLICLSVEFLFLTGPVSVYLMFEDTFSRGAGEDVNIAAANKVALALGSIMWHTNNAIHFYTYCLTGAKYREEFLHLLGFHKKQKIFSFKQEHSERSRSAIAARLQSKPA